ncbi:MAG: DNA polymerase III subunit alpha [Candidatus Nealsonbacteria bacterium]|nr:DNA polymerase III subunit alpha [Candidatus Nealsonbacteria bacterium]
MDFTHLHVHSHYSLLDGLSKIDELLDYVKESGMDSIALTDHGVLYGAVEFVKKAKEKGVKPIIGCEVYVALESMDQKRPNIDDKRHHLVLLVKNDKGYQNLVKLVSKANLEGYYYKPRADEDLLEKHSEGLIALSACIQGKIPRLVINNKIKEAEETALKYQRIFGKGNFYLELQSHPNIKEQVIANKGLIEISKRTGIPLVATNDCHYLRKEDLEAQDVLMLINTGAKLNDPERLTMKDNDFSVKSPEEMADNFKDVPEAIKNTQKIKDLCNFEFKFDETKLPSFPLPEKKEYNEYLRELCLEGMKGKCEEHLPEKVMERLDYELEVIKKTGFASYFLIVQDLVNWAKNNKIIVGPGRGSVGGSLVAYLLNITDIDPLKYDLLFERFLNPERISMPDIDLDFADRRRDEVIHYVADKYGHDKVAQIITFGTMAARAVIRDVGRALNYSYLYCDLMAKMVPFGLSLSETLENVSEFKELYDNDSKAKELIDIAKKLEGVARHASTHACGVVISKDPLDEIVPLQHPSQNEDGIVTQYEMKSIESLGLLKMDFLGLKNLTIIEDTLAKIYVIRGEKINIGKIPLDNKKTYDILKKGETIGIFQLESGGMQRYLKQLKPTEFEDIIAILALYRPGPMELIPDYIARKNKEKRVEYIHPKLKPILEKTYSIPIYQEQIMRIAQDLAGFSLAEADVLRKAMGKKNRELLMKQKDKFIDGATENGVQKEVAKQVWEWIMPFASYGFNKSHSAGYATIAYQTAYLKTHYPCEFMSSLLTSDRKDIERISFLIEECKRMKIEVLPPDINESYVFFSVVPNKKQIRFGLAAIKNVGMAITEAIVKERKKNGHFKSLNDFINRVKTKNLNKKSLENLTKAGVFDSMMDRNKILSNINIILERARELNKNKLNGQSTLFAKSSFSKEEINLENAPLALRSDKLRWEKELLGLFVTSHPLDDFRAVLGKGSTSLVDAKKSISGQKIRVGGIISGVKKIITKSGKPMLFVSLEDLTDKIEIIVFSTTMKKNLSVFEENKIAFITGKIDHRDGAPKIICDQAEEILEN